MNACAVCNTDKQARLRFVSCQNKFGILCARLLADKPALPYKLRMCMHTTTLTIGKEKTGISMQDTHATKLKRTHKHVKKAHASAQQASTFPHKQIYKLRRPHKVPVPESKE